MKDIKTSRRGEGAEVLCAWCGGVMRRDAAKAARGMCQPCFARMMREHIEAHQPHAQGRVRRGGR